MNKSELVTAGFAPAKRSPRRLILNIQGMPKVGKTSLALSAPKPVGYIAVEVGGEEGVVDKFIPDGASESPDIHVAQIRVESPVYPSREDFKSGKDGDRDFQEAVSEAVQSVFAPALDNFYAAYYASLANMATTIVDTGSDLWEIMRLANFGRLEKVPQLAYGQLNKSADKLLDDAKSFPGNTIWTHHMKEKWENVTGTDGKTRGQPTGVFEMAGYSGVKKKVQATVELWREDLAEENPETGLFVNYNAQIIDSRHNSAAMGKRFSTLEISFADIAMSVFPGSSVRDWV